MAFIIEKNDKNTIEIQNLPIKCFLKNGQEVSLGRFEESDFQEVKQILNQIIEEGTSYPQENTLTDQQFRDYYLSHDAFVMKKKIDETQSSIVGAFYIKPNFPGRSSHVCNAGFIVDKQNRGLGIGQILVSHYLFFAKIMGYRASLFNLVLATNAQSVQLYEKLNFTRISTIKQCSKQNNGTYVDCHQYYYDLTEDLKEPVTKFQN